MDMEKSKETHLLRYQLFKDKGLAVWVAAVINRWGHWAKEGGMKRPTRYAGRE